MGIPDRLEIDVTKSGIFLFRFDSSGACIADTWHGTIEEAKEQARFEFDVPVDAWTEVIP